MRWSKRAARVVVLAVSISLLPGCAVKKTISMNPVAGGAPGELTFHSNVLAATSGDVRVVLPDGNVLDGRWSELSSGQSLAAFYVNTPSGVISGAALASDGSAWGVATLSGRGVTMLCVYSGKQTSGYGRCADSLGREWVGNW